MDDKPYNSNTENSQSWSAVEYLSLRRRARLWVVPVAVAVVAIVGSWIAVEAIERTFRATLDKKLRTIVAATANSISLWSEQQTLNARMMAGDDRIERLVARLTTSEDPTVLSGVRSQLRERLKTASHQFGFTSFAVIDASGKTLVSDGSSIGFDESQLSQFSQVFCGETVFAEPSLTEGESICRVAPLRVAAPIQTRRGNEILATLVCEIPSHGQFLRTLEVSTFGDSGRNYAIDGNGRAIGTLPGRGSVPEELARSVANSRDSALRQEQEISTVVNATGFRTSDERHLVGGGKWLPNFGIGVVSTIDHDEAYASHNLFKRINSFVTGVALFGSVLGLIYTWYLSRAQLRALQAERRLQKLGQYVIEDKIGEGGMGEVYRAQHRMLRRPTAVKLLPAKKSSPQAIERFEQEVRLTSQLTHPNTISIYDYGRTSEGVFYYAMEYLDGIDLKKLVDLTGAQQEARVVHILRQICGSLAEAHNNGLVHRDIKPANVILCQRGGKFDVAKLLDFGLVYDANSLRAATQESGINGTPAFMSPESIESATEVDERSDIYSLGAVAYFLLTGRYTFTGSSVAEIWSQQLGNLPIAPSKSSLQPISRKLETLTMRCLAIDANDRPQSIEEVDQILEELQLQSYWSQDEARASWLADSSIEQATIVNDLCDTDLLHETLAYIAP